MKKVIILLFYFELIFIQLFSMDISDQTEFLEKELYSYYNQSLTPELAKKVVNTILDYDQYYFKTLNQGLPRAIEACKKAGMSPELIAEVIIATTKASSPFNIWPALENDLPLALENLNHRKLSISQKARLITNSLANIENSAGAVLRYGLKASLDSLDGEKLTTKDKISIIIKITKKARDYSWSALEDALPTLLKNGINPQETPDLIGRIVNLSNKQANMIFRHYLAQLLFKDHKRDLEKEIKGIRICIKYTRQCVKQFAQFGQIVKIKYQDIKDKIDLAENYAVKLNQYYKRNKSSKEISQKAAVIINVMHDNDDSSDLIRKAIAKNTTFRTKYFLIAQADPDLYQTSFEALYRNFPLNSIEQIKKDIDPQGRFWTNFVLRLANRNKLDELLQQDPKFFEQSIKQALDTKNYDRLFYNGTVLVNTFIAFYENLEFKSQKEYFEPVLIEKYKHAQTATQKGVLGYLIKLNELTCSPEFKSEIIAISRELPEIPEPIVPEHWLADGKLIVKQYFYPDESWFSKTINIYQLPPYNMEIQKRKKNEIILNKFFNDKALVMILSLSKEDVDDVIQGNQVDVIVHRGHSYHLKTTFGGECKKEKLLYLGSCGSFSDTPEILRNYPMAQVISDDNKSSGAVNNWVVYNIAKKIIQGERKWEKLQTEFAKNKGLIFPHQRNQLIVKFLNQLLKENNKKIRTPS